MELEGDDDINWNWLAQYDPQKLGKGVETNWKSEIDWNHPNNSSTKIGQNTEKSSGNLGRLAITQTPVKDHQLTLMRKTRKEGMWKEG